MIHANLTADELLRYVDFSGPYGEQIKEILLDYVPFEEFDEELHKAYEQGFENGYEEAESKIARVLKQILGDDLNVLQKLEKIDIFVNEYGLRE